MRLPAHLIKGRECEKQARVYLESQGLTFLEQNYRSRYGEIDLIMQDQTTLVFVEVRYRDSNAFGSAAETVDIRKQNKLRTTAEYYLQQHQKYKMYPCRFDVVAASPDTSKNNLNWLKNAFGI